MHIQSIFRLNCRPNPTLTRKSEQNLSNEILLGRIERLYIHCELIQRRFCILNCKSTELPETRFAEYLAKGFCLGFDSINGIPELECSLLLLLLFLAHQRQFLVAIERLVIIQLVIRRHCPSERRTEKLGKIGLVFSGA